MKSSTLPCWWERKCFCLHSSHKTFTLYTILFIAFFTVPSPPANVQKCLNLPYLVWYKKKSHFRNRWSICCVSTPHILRRMWVCSSGTALNLSYSCGGVFWLGHLSPPHLKQCFTILWAFIPILLHTRRRIFRGLKPPATHLFMQYCIFPNWGILFSEI